MIAARYKKNWLQRFWFPFECFLNEIAIPSQQIARARTNLKKAVEFRFFALKLPFNKKSRRCSTP